MSKCDVCGKSSLIPVKLGKSSVCKSCFLKINGPLWKFKAYEKFSDAENTRNKVLKKAYEQNFPPIVIDDINNFFNQQTIGMMKCDACGEVIKTLQPFGNAKICKKCFSKINTSEWKQTEYLSNDDVETNRNKILKKACKYGYPPVVIDGINKYFDNKIQKGLFRIVDGGLEQLLKVYETHCVLVTMDDFDVNEISKKYSKLNKSSSGNILSNIGADTIVRSLLTGSVVKAGISLATSAVVNATTNSISNEKVSFKLVKGGITINYNDFDRIEYKNVGDDELGFLRFRNSMYGCESAEDIVFFFDDDSYMKQVYSYINEKISIAHKQSQMTENSKNPEVNNTSVADEILKFKNLLDIGAITQEEFDTKKRELLKM
ncbi:SHOCT domain-containing protein [Ruminococcus sp.]